jgi:peptidoglycan/LPS O-acetylase OafA/YrhL
MYLESNIRKYEYIDLLRGIAILGVIAVHSHQGIVGLNPITSAAFNYGQMGVQLFFVASALTLCLSMSERREAYPINFYIRRFFRIAPAYYLAIPLYFVWRTIMRSYSTGSFEIPQEYSVEGVLQNLFFVHGFFPNNYNFVVPGGWSISTEMVFYVIFPVFFIIQARLTLYKLFIVGIFVAFMSFVSGTFLYITFALLPKTGYVKMMDLDTVMLL